MLGNIQEKQLQDLIVRHLARAGDLELDTDVSPDAEIGSNAFPIGSLAYVQGLIAVEDDLGVAFADRLFADVQGATIADVVAFAQEALNSSAGE